MHSANPSLQSWLCNLSLQEVNELRQDNKHLADEVTLFLPELQKIQKLIEIPESEEADIALPKGFDSGIPGRKLDQILSMSQSVLNQSMSEEWLEWCSGKGYLGRILAYSSERKVTSLEYQTCLCKSGQVEADKLGLPMHFVQGDAFADEVADVFNKNQHAVALHACGDLHVRLLQIGSGKHLPAMSVAPCCYHLVKAPMYEPLSKSGMKSKLCLTKDELRIPLQELVTGGARVQRHREQEMTYRLGLDSMLRSSAENDTYIPIPSIKKSLLSNGFEWFCQWAADQKQLYLPSKDFEQFNEIGKKRFEKMEKLSLIQDLFKRPLEMWLIYDKSLFLKEKGYKVNVSTFCDRSVSPRNILIQASLTV